MTTFDPYYKWLGIPPDEQPPNHYRLLGLRDFESDSEVIDTAANKQMSYLHGCATGDHAAEAERLQNEIAAARLCLLNAGKKAQYDETLKDSVAASDSQPAKDLAGHDFSNVTLKTPSPGRKTSSRKKPKPKNAAMIWMVAGAGKKAQYDETLKDSVAASDSQPAKDLAGHDFSNVTLKTPSPGRKTSSRKKPKPKNAAMIWMVAGAAVILVAGLAILNMPKEPSEPGIETAKQLPQTEDALREKDSTTAKETVGSHSPSIPMASESGNSPQIGQGRETEQSKGESESAGSANPVVVTVWDAKTSVGQTFRARLHSDGTFRLHSSPSTVRGTWSKSRNRVVVKWNEGWVATLQVEDGGRSMKGSSHLGIRTTWMLVETIRE